MNKKPYNFSADIIRVLAICGVVVIHTVDSVYGRPDFFGGISWWFAIFLNSVSRTAIPLFILLSGFFLLNKEETYKQTLSRTWNRLVIPLLFWFVVMTIWTAGNPTLQNVGFGMIKQLLTVNVFILFFLIILIGLYCTAPILRSFFKAATDKTKRIFVISALAFGCIVYFFQYLFYQCTPANSFTYWLPFTGLFVAGYYLGNKSPESKRTKSIIGIYGLMLLLTIIGDYLYYSLKSQGNLILNDHGCLSYYSNSYLSVNVVLMSLAAFVLLMHWKFTWIKNEIVRKLIYSIARLSLAIYIIHIFVLNILDSKLHLFDQITPVWFYIIVKFFVIFVLSYLLAFVLTKTPLIKRTLGER